MGGWQLHAMLMAAVCMCNSQTEHAAQLWNLFLFLFASSFVYPRKNVP